MLEVAFIDNSVEFISSNLIFMLALLEFTLKILDEIDVLPLIVPLK